MIKINEYKAWLNVEPMMFTPQTQPTVRIWHRVEVAQPIDHVSGNPPYSGRRRSDRIEYDLLEVQNDCTLLNDCRTVEVWPSDDLDNILRPK